MFRPRASLAAALAAGLCAAPACADHHEEDAALTAPGMHAGAQDRQIMAILTPMNRTQVDLGKFAAERASTPAVKDFARTMIEAHEELGQRLARATRRADAHGTLTRAQRRRAEAPLRDDGVVTDEEAENVEERMERRRELREEREDVVEEVADERAELEEEAREELQEAREEFREEIREERVDSLGDAVDEAVRDVREAGDEAGEEARELGDGARRAGRRMRDGVREGAADLARRTDRALNENDTPRRGMRGGDANLRTEIARKSHEMVKEALGRQRGKQFDMGYLNHQMLAHMHMLAAVQVSAEHAGPELKTVLEDARGKMEAHLLTARELGTKIDLLED